MKQRPAPMALAAALVFGTGPAIAATSTVVLEEVVVTARKKAETLSDVPLSISAFSSDAIEQRGIDDLNELAYQTPGLVFDSFIGQQLSVPTIRGISPVNVLAEEVNTAIFVDGVYVSGRQGLNFSMLDLERIEVVKGPQSAMYGRNSFSGAINFVTKRPTSEFEGKLKATVGNDGIRRLQVSTSGPLVDGKLSGRLALARDEFDGSYDNDNGDDFGGHQYNTANASLWWTPTDHFEAQLNVYYSDDEINPPAVSFVNPNCQPSGSGTFQTYCGTIPAVDTNELSRHPLGTGEERELLRTNLRLNWDLNGYSLSSLTGYNKLDHYSRADYSRDGKPTQFAYINGVTIPFAFFETNLIRTDYNDYEEFSQELRIDSPDDKALRWTAGAYYFKVNTSIERRFGATDALPSDFITFVGPSVVYSPFFSQGINTPYDQADSKTESWAVFGALEYDFTESLTGRMELRYAEEEKTLEQSLYNSSPLNADLNDTWYQTTGRLSLNYTLPDNSLIYASAANGIKSGGFDVDGLRDSPNDAVFDEEKNISYEVGYKTRLWDERLAVDTALFWIDWSDIQLPAFTQDGQSRKTINAGDAVSRGIEISLSAALNQYLTANAGLSYTLAEYTDAQSVEFARWPKYAPNGEIDGNEMQRTSETQINLGLEFNDSFANGLGYFIRGDLSYQSEQYTGADNLAKLPSRTLFNLRAGLEDSSWRLELWGENLTDEDAPSSAFTDVYLNNVVNGQIAIFMPRIVVSHPKRRTYGITATYYFH